MMAEMDDIRKELAQLEDLLAGLPRRVPDPYAQALQDSDWLRGQVPMSVHLARRHMPPGAAAVAAASLATGLFTSPPGYALEIPPPPVVQAPMTVAGTVAGAMAVAETVAVTETGAEAEAGAVAGAVAGTEAETGAGTEARAGGAGIQLPFESLRTSPAAEVEPKKTAKKRISARKGAKTLAKPRHWHTIAPGETLIKLARKYYDGSGAHWKGIFAFNKHRVKSAHRVFPGDQILIPSLAEAIAAERGQMPLLAGGDLGPPRKVARTDRGHRHDRWRHKTRVAHRDPIKLPKPGEPI